MPLSDDDRIALDVYNKLYSEHATQARHHDTLRATVSGLVAAAIGGLLGFSKSATYATHVGWVILALSTLGALLSLKHYERSSLHTRMQISFSDQIDAILLKSGFPVQSVFLEARKIHRSRFPLLNRLRLYLLWMVIFFLLGGVGLYIVFGEGK